jgi:hypothetical protein
MLSDELHVTSCLEMGFIEILLSLTSNMVTNFKHITFRFDERRRKISFFTCRLLVFIRTFREVGVPRSVNVIIFLSAY